MNTVIQNAKDGIITPTQLQNFILWLFTLDAYAYVSEKFINANLGVIRHTGKLKNGQLLKSGSLIALYRCVKINPYFKIKLFDRPVIISISSFKYFRVVRILFRDLLTFSTMRELDF